MIKAVLFDLDGTIIDTRDTSKIFFNGFMEYYKLPKPADGAIDGIYNLTAWEGAAKLYPKIPEARIKKMMEEYSRFAHTNEESKKRLYESMKIHPMLHEILKRLKKKYQLGIVTGRGKSTYYLLDYFGLSGYFNPVVDMTMYKNPKPHPEPLQVAIEKLGINPEEAVYVGDGKPDVESAIACGAKPILLIDTGKIEELENILDDLNIR